MSRLNIARLEHTGLQRFARNDGHCEEQSDEAIKKFEWIGAIFNCGMYSGIKTLQALQELWWEAPKKIKNTMGKW